MSLSTLEGVNIRTHDNCILIGQNGEKWKQEHFALTFAKLPMPDTKKNSRPSDFKITVPKQGKRKNEEDQKSPDLWINQSLRKSFLRPSFSLAFIVKAPFRFIYNPRNHYIMAEMKRRNDDIRRTTLEKNFKGETVSYAINLESKKMTEGGKPDISKSDKISSKSSHESEPLKKLNSTSEINPEYSNSKILLKVDSRNDNKDSNTSQENRIEAIFRKNSSNTNSKKISEEISNDISETYIVSSINEPSPELTYFEKWSKNCSQNNAKKPPRKVGKREKDSGAESGDSKDAIREGKKDKKEKKESKKKKGDAGSTDAESGDSKTAKTDSKKDKREKKESKKKKGNAGSTDAESGDSKNAKTDLKKEKRDNKKKEAKREEDSTGTESTDSKNAKKKRKSFKDDKKDAKKDAMSTESESEIESKKGKKEEKKENKKKPIKDTESTDADSESEGDPKGKKEEKKDKKITKKGEKKDAKKTAESTASESELDERKGSKKGKKDSKKEARKDAKKDVTTSDSASEVYFKSDTKIVVKTSDTESEGSQKLKAEKSTDESDATSTDSKKGTSELKTIFRSSSRKTTFGEKEKYFQRNRIPPMREKPPLPPCEPFVATPKVKRVCRCKLPPPSPKPRYAPLPGVEWIHKFL